MILKPVNGAHGQIVWIAETDDKEHDAVGESPLDAISRLAILLEYIILSNQKDEK